MPLRLPLLSTTMLSSVIGGIFLSTFSVGAADLMTKGPYATAPVPLQLPAVDGLNGKIEGFGGSLQSEGFAGVQGSISFPLAPQFGFQVDGVAASLGSDFLGSLGAHIFWRNPGVGLVGVYAATTHWDRLGGASSHRVALEGEYYWARVTLRGIAGVEGGSSASTILNTGAFTLFESVEAKTRFFDMVNLDFYATDNLRLTVGHRYLGGRNSLALGGEYAFPLGNAAMASVFGEGRIGEDDARGVWGGLKVYFGKRDKPLIARHRQDDPWNWGVDTALSLVKKKLKKNNNVECCIETPTLRK